MHSADLHMHTHLRIQPNHHRRHALLRLHTQPRRGLTPRETTWCMDVQHASLTGCLTGCETPLELEPKCLELEPKMAAATLEAKLLLFSMRREGWAGFAW